MTVTDIRPRTRTIPDDLLERVRARAAAADRDNTFFTEDFEELREIGYLLAPVPEEHGGWGLDLDELAREQRRLARHSGPTALALSMHFYWVGLAADFLRRGDTSLVWMLEETAAGHVQAAGHAEPGNDVPVLLSTTKAERVEGGWRFTGHKMFGSLSPVWTRLNVHAMDTSDPASPVTVHASIERGSEGVRTIDTWDTLGMRATQSHDTKLEGVFVPDARVQLVHPAGDPNDPFLGSMLAWALTLIANAYTGIAERAFELAVTSARKKTSIAIERGAVAYNPFVQHQVAEMWLELDAVRALIDGLARDWVTGVDHGDEWASKIYSAKWHAVEGAKRVVDRALDVAGGGSIFKGNELERLYRDVRPGGFHPGTDAATHEVIGKIALGIAAEPGPRF